MGAALFALILLSVAIVLAVVIISRRDSERDRNSGEEIVPPLIQASGVYSIIRKSPREDLRRIRPDDEEIRKYLASINEDFSMQPLTSSDKQKLIELWRNSMEENIRTIEKGDATGSAFYYLLDLSGDSRCRVCASHFKKRQIITREEIFKNPSIIPPFHLGCTTRIIPFQEHESGDSSILDTSLLFNQSGPPAIPDWKITLRIGEN